ncbi:MAG: phosphoglycerate kinase [Candidatus Colwellbacteria bacterium]|nr:phosphoglycerate kinase [Candidatus Colwellbacteria bacterium]
MTYLLRVNLDISDKDITKNLRFKNTLDGIRFVSRSNNKVVILAHRGRPNGRDRKLSLRPFVNPLSKGLGKKVTFVEDFDFAKITKRIEKSPNGALFLLENLRFIPGEIKASKSFAKLLASLGDKFINDDFPTSHHKNASNFELPNLLPSSLGPNFNIELRQLDKVMRHPRKPLVLIIGGAKTSDKLGVLKNFINKADTILLGGVPANTMLKARGVHIGKSLYDPKTLSQIKPFALKEKIVTPVDWKVKKDVILDIGPMTTKLYMAAVKNAKTVVWNGPMGKFEDESFSMGTNALYKAILAQKTANILIGGGDTMEAVASLAKPSKHIFVSSGGGAMLTYLSGEKLPAVEAIK